MADLKPKFEFGGTGVALSLTGDTNSNTTIDNITDTVGTIVGQFIEGTDIPAGTTVISFTSTTIVISAAATGTTASVSLTLFTRITMDFPPQGDNERERISTKIRRTITNNGTLQHQFNYNEESIGPRFVFVSETLMDLLRDFYKGHSSRGFDFKYFESSDESAFRTVTMASFNYAPKKEAPTNITDEYIYDLNMSFRQTL